MTTYITGSAFQKVIDRRTPRCHQIIEAYRQNKKELTRVFVLSCKREAELRRFIESGPAELWKQAILVDNGSGFPSVFKVHLTETFGAIVWHPENIGMGPAINHALLQFPSDYVLFLEDDLVMESGYADLEWIKILTDIFRHNPCVGIIKLKSKENWDQKPTRVIGPLQRTPSGVLWHPWLPSSRWAFWWGNRPWHAGIHNVWSLGPVMFRWCAWAENGPLPVARGRGQAAAAEDYYARRFNRRWIAARPVHIRPFSQPVTAQSPGYADAI